MVVELHEAALAAGGRQLFSDLSFVARPGCRVAVTGGSDMERSFFLRVLLGMKSLDSGWMCLDGEPMPARLAAYFRQYISYMPRLLDFGDMSMADVAGFMRRGAGKGADTVEGNALRECLDMLGVPHDCMSRSLSGVDRSLAQRAVMALTFAPRLPIALLDSPTLFQDELGRKTVADFLASEWFDGSVIVVATQDPALLALADETIDISANNI